MNQLITSSQLTMSSREIAALLESRHRDVCVSISRLMDSGAISGYAATPYTHEQNQQTYFEYFVSKRDSYVIVAQMSPAFTAALVDRWQELESQLSTNALQLPNFNDPVEAARAWADEKEKTIKQEKQLLLAAPKVKFVDNFTCRDALQNATQVAQTMSMSAVKLNRALDEIGGIYNKSVKRGRVFCQSFIDNGFGKMIQNEIGYPQAMFTTLGIVEVTRIMHSEGVI